MWGRAIQAGTKHMQWGKAWEDTGHHGEGVGWVLLDTTISSRGCGDGKRGGWQGRWNPEHLLFSALIVGSALKQQGSLGFEAGE